jgi:hypothetical protein
MICKLSTIYIVQGAEKWQRKRRKTIAVHESQKESMTYGLPHTLPAL